MNLRREATMDEWKAYGVVGTVLVAFVTGFWAWFGGKKKGQTDYQVAVQQGFQSLVEELQEERQRLMAVISDQAREISELRGEVRQLSQGIASMQRLLIEHGINIPAEFK